MATIKQNTPNAHSRILGMGAYRPSVTVTNDDVCQWIESSDEWIVKRTGINTRMRAPQEVSVLEMAEHAAREALASAGLTGEQLSAIIVSTVTFPYRGRPVPAGMSLPMMTFSLRPSSGSLRPLIAASVRTRVVSWNEAADSHESVASDAFVMPMSSGRPEAG